MLNLQLGRPAHMTVQSDTSIDDTALEPRAGLLFEHLVHTTGYERADGLEPVTYEITAVIDGKVFYGPAQRGIETRATYWIWEREFARDALGTWVGDRSAQ
jgi:hypothetical protein